MQVNRIQNYNTSFHAQLKIDGEMFYGEVFEKMFDKAAKIGTEKDVIEIKYVGSFSGNPKKATNKAVHKGTFIARLIQKGNKSGVDKVRQELSDSSRYAYREKAKKAATEYIDNLYAKYVK